MDENTPEFGGEVSQPLAANPEQFKSEPVSSVEDRFKEKLASLRGQKPSVEKPLTEATPNAKVDEPAVGDRVAETDIKNVKPKQENRKHDLPQGRINGLVRKIGDRDNRIKQLEAELAKYSAELKPRDAFSNDAEYIADISTTKAEQTTVKREYEREKEQRYRDEVEVYHEKVAMQVDNPEVYHERAKKYVNHIDEITENYVMNSDVGYKMLDFIMDQFEKSPASFDEFRRMPIAKKNMLLVNLEKQVTSPTEPKPNTVNAVSKAPQSIAPVKGEKLSEPVGIDSRFKAKLNTIRAGYRR